MRTLTLFATLMASVVPALAQGLDPGLAGTWRVVEINGVAPTARATMRFDGTHISGAAPCNRYSAVVKQTGSTIEIGGPITTRMFCDGRMDAERQFLDALQAVRGYTLSGQQASLVAGDGRVVLKLAR